MDIDILLKVVQAVVSVLLIIVVLLQNQGSGLSGVFGGSGNVYRTKRGIEKTLFSATVVLSVLFFGISILNLVI